MTLALEVALVAAGLRFLWWLFDSRKSEHVSDEWIRHHATQREEPLDRRWDWDTWDKRW